MLVDCYEEGRAFSSVLPGDLVGGRAATEHLLSVGRRRIGFINGQQGVDAARDRLKDYRQALASADIAFDPDLVRPGNWEPTAGYEMTRELRGNASNTSTSNGRAGLAASQTARAWINRIGVRLRGRPEALERPESGHANDKMAGFDQADLDRRQSMSPQLLRALELRQAV